jgi:hypothetical protein
MARYRFDPLDVPSAPLAHCIACARPHWARVICCPYCGARQLPVAGQADATPAPDQPSPCPHPRGENAA